MLETHRVMALIHTLFKGLCLDAGVGDSRNLQLLPEGSIGLDLRISNRLEKYEYIRSDLNCKLPFREEELDAILCAHVLEHLSNPTTTLQEFYRTLKENGLLIIAIPNPNCIYCNFYDSDLFPEHTNAWSKNQMRLILRHSHFKVLKTYINFPFFANRWFGLLWNNIPLLDRIWCDWWFICQKLGRDRLTNTNSI